MVSYLYATAIAQSFIKQESILKHLMYLFVISLVTGNFIKQEIYIVLLLLTKVPVFL